jgi:uncharacterized membrane protein YeaQ/YmgE (transglycosylase-associated protein family)
MHFVGSLIIGLIAGAVAKLIMPGKDPGGFFVTMGLGVVGALLATFLGRAVGWYNEGEGGGFIAAVVGSIVILAVYRWVKGKRKTV